MSEYFIGREEHTEKPRLALSSDGKTVFLGNLGIVPKSVSRKHCVLKVNDTGKLSVEDVTADNFLFVNGTECKIKTNLSYQDVLELGPDHFQVKVADIVNAFPKTYNIRHLKLIYENYENGRLNIQVSQGKFNAFRSLPMIVSPLMFILSALLPEGFLSLPGDSAKYIGYVISVLLGVVLFMLTYKKGSNTPVQYKRLEERFRQDYVCPNPACRHFLGRLGNYDDLLSTQNHSCPFCKSKWEG